MFYIKDEATINIMREFYLINFSVLFFCDLVLP